MQRGGTVTLYLSDATGQFYVKSLDHVVAFVYQSNFLLDLYEVMTDSGLCPCCLDVSDNHGLCIGHMDFRTAWLNFSFAAEYAVFRCCVRCGIAYICWMYVWFEVFSNKVWSLCAYFCDITMQMMWFARMILRWTKYLCTFCILSLFNRIPKLAVTRT